MQSAPGPHHFRDGLGPCSTEDEASGELTPHTHVEAIISVFLAVTIFYVLSRCRRLAWRSCHPFSVLLTSLRTTVKPWTRHLMLLHTRFSSVQLSPSVWWKFLVED